MSKGKINTKLIAGTGILLAIELVLQAIANIIQIGTVSLNFSAIPIALASIMFGPISSSFLGLCSGIMTLLAPSTSFFYNENIWGTVVTCLLKGLLSGLIPALVYLPFKNKEKVNFIGVILASLLVPLVNTGSFIGFCFLFFQGIYQKQAEAGLTPFAYFTIGLVGWNFIFEFLTTLLLSPTVYKLIIYNEKRRHIGA